MNENKEHPLSHVDPSVAKAVAATKPEEQPLPAGEIVRSRAVRGNIVFFFAVLIGLGIAWKMRTVLGIVYVSALFAVVLMPMVNIVQKIKLGKWSPSRPVAIVVLIGTVFLALAAFFVIGLPPVIHDAQHASADLPQRVPVMVAKIKRLPLANKIGIDDIAAKAQAGASSAAGFLIAKLPSVFERTLDLVTAFILCVYFMLEGEFTYYYFLSFFPAYKRERLARTLTTAESRVSKWLIGQGSLMLILGVLSVIVFGFLHVRYFVLLGVLMGLFNIIPVAGGLITIVLVAGVAAMDSWGKMAGVLIFYLIYTQIENAFLTPRIMKTSVDLAGLAVLIALLAGSALAGIVGALVSVPTAALLAVFIDEYMVQPDARDLATQAQTSS